MLTGQLLDFVCDYESELPEDGQDLCMDLVDMTEKLRIHANRRPGNRKIIVNDVSALGKIFSELIDALLMKKIQVNHSRFYLCVTLYLLFNLYYNINFSRW